jgi:hypothetical protein
MNKKVAFFMLILIPFMNCGKKGPLKLDPEVTLKDVNNFQVYQVGNNIRFTWDFPLRLGDNKTDFNVDMIKRIDVFYSKKEVPHHKFRKKSTLLKKFKFEEISEYTEKPRFELFQQQSPSKKKKKKQVTYTVDIPFKVKDLNEKSHYFALSYIYKKKKSPLSKIATIITNTPVIPIGDLKITKEKKLIKLKWSKPKLDVLGSSVVNISGYDIYRKITNKKQDDSSTEQEDIFVKLNTNKVLTEFYDDTDTGIDGEYHYYIVTIVTNNITSAPSSIANIKISDIYAPDIPVNLVSFKAPGHILLSWRKVNDKDFSHYRVYRKSETMEEYKLIADNIATNQYKDKRVRRNTMYFYVVTAVDDKGNESEFSKIVEAKF